MNPLLALTARRDRLVGALLVYATAGYGVLGAVTLAVSYDSAADRAALARTAEGNPTFAVLLGPARDLERTGGLVAWRTYLLGATIAALGAVLLTVRHTRAEEQRGLTEVVRATAVARLAPVWVAVGWTGGLVTVAGALLAIALLAIGLPATGAVLQAAGVATTAVLFAAVAAVAAQLTATARASRGLAGAILAAAFLLRGIADAGGPGWLRWLTPLGWAGEVRPFAGDRLWPLAPTVAATAALLVGIQRLERVRDLGTAMLAPPRPGAARAGARLRSELGLAWRLQRAAVLAWTAGLVALGIALGATAASADAFARDGGAAAELLLRGGGDPADGFVAATVVVLALAAAGFAVQAMLRVYEEERSGRLELLLAATGRRGPALLSHGVIATVGSAAVLVAGGGAMGAVRAVDGGAGADVLVAVLALLPAVLVLGGVAALLAAAVPRAALGAWGVLVACLLLWIAGPLLGLPSWVQQLSPFELLRGLPADGPSPSAIVATVAVAAALAVGGRVAFGRRDLG